MTDWFEQPGLVLFTERYAECVAFYRDTLLLPVMFETDTLTTLRLGSGYLMVETGGRAVPAGKPREQNPFVLRFNVADLAATAEMLRGRGVAVDVQSWDWGTIGVFLDPDGNRCEVRSRFTRQ